MKKKTDGMTMVEVIVAFAVLMIGLAGMYKVTLSSWNMVIKSSEIQSQVDDLMNQYYKDKLSDKILAEETIGIKEETNTVDTFSLVIKDAENDDGYHIYYYESPKEGGK